jgi:hypothetical protein
MYWKVSLIIFIALSAASSAVAGEKNITPYGDYKDSESYGACKMLYLRQTNKS